MNNILTALKESTSQLTTSGWITLVTVLALIVITAVIGRSRKRWNSKMLAYGAMAVALSFLLSCIRLYRMPQGGSITPASMLPLMLFSAAFGVGPGLMAGMADGVLQYLQGGWFAHPVQFLLDYVLAYGLIGLAGLHRHMPPKWSKWSLYLAMVIAAAARALSATLAGVFFWETAPWASLVYNGAYLIPDTLICIVLAVLAGNRLLREMRKGL